MDWLLDGVMLQAKAISIALLTTLLALGCAASGGSPSTPPPAAPESWDFSQITLRIQSSDNRREVDSISEINSALPFSIAFPNPSDFPEGIDLHTVQVSLPPKNVARPDVATRAMLLFRDNANSAVGFQLEQGVTEWGIGEIDSTQSVELSDGSQVDVAVKVVNEGTEREVVVSVFEGCGVHIVLTGNAVDRDFPERWVPLIARSTLESCI
jgi:hypothetical protein